MVGPVGTGVVGLDPLAVVHLASFGVADQVRTGVVGPARTGVVGLNPLAVVGLSSFGVVALAHAEVVDQATAGSAPECAGRWADST